MQRATLIFSVVRDFCGWSDDATLQEKLDAGSKLFQAKSLYHPALHWFLEKLSGFLEMAAEVCSEAEKQHAAEESGSGDAFRAVRSLIDLSESDYSERVFLANLSEDDFVAHCQGFKDVSQVQIALGLQGYADQRLVVDFKPFFKRAKIAFERHGERNRSCQERQRFCLEGSEKICTSYLRGVCSSIWMWTKRFPAKTIYAGSAAPSSRQI